MKAHAFVLHHAVGLHDGRKECCFRACICVHMLQLPETEVMLQFTVGISVARLRSMHSRR